MKKTGFMRAALLLLVLTLITSCFVGGTFAKYTTSATGSDTARVAKFGVQITATGATFAKEYATDDAGVAATIAKSVVSTGENVVAPGTKGDMVKMALSGTPEVAVRVGYTAHVTVSNWTVDGGFYCPITIKVKGEDGISHVFHGLDYTDAGQFALAVENQIATFSANYAAQTDLNAAGVTAPEVSWAWVYEGVDEHQTNEKDTALGNAVEPATITLEIETTVTQID